jgi:hypothetical protein
LVPGSWLLEGRYHPSGRPSQRVLGATEVRAAEEFPETLRVEGEVRDAENPAAKPVRSTYHLDVAGSGAIRFRMDSLPLATVLTGEGHFDDAVLVFRYASPDRRLQGVETYVRCSEDEMRASGVLLAEGAPVTAWLVRLERLRRDRRR